jgi:hypothetical protein
MKRRGEDIIPLDVMGALGAAILLVFATVWLRRQASHLKFQAAPPSRHEREELVAKGTLSVFEC